MPNNIFLTSENLAFAMPLILICIVYVSATNLMRKEDPSIVLALTLQTFYYLRLQKLGLFQVNPAQNWRNTFSGISWFSKS